MKNMKSKVKVLGMVFLMFVTSSIYAQFDQLGSVLSTGVDDAGKILGAYITPYANGMGASLSGGWYNTAKTHKLGGFDVTITANVVFIPTSDQSYNPNDLNLGDPDNGINVTIDGDKAPTAAGDKKSGPEVTYNKNVLGTDVPFTQFNLPKGSDFAYAAMPMVQAGIGLVKETELIFRYSPELKYGEGGKVGLWGIGIKHGIKQWIPAIKKLPVLEMSVHGGYTKLSSTNSLNLQPSFYEGFAQDFTIFPGYYSNQEMVMEIKNTSANFLVSANLPVICIYGGVGVSYTNTNLKLNGKYPIAEVQDLTNVIISESTAVTNPIDMDIKNTDVRLNAGLRIKMAVVTLHFDYTYADYSIATAGLGISLR
ncbi:MAG: hypothetical protein JEY96_04435 [Bacteroidales bacterium]|nr:hypothetical protein [Bacteroidales bacterium]